MESKKINQLATELTPSLSDLTIIGDPSTGISKKITLSQMASLFTGTVEEYANVAAFPLVGVADTIYIALDTNVLYRWNTGTSAYVELSPNIINSLVFSDANGFDGNISLVGSTATLTITTALTTGSVPFIGASGALSQDNANLFFDDTNNRLGINTNAPTTSLDVFGSGIIGRLNGTSTNNSFLGFASAGTNKWSIGNVQSDHRFRIYNEATTSELVSVLQTGEFGIGIANPTTKLHIDGGATSLIANLDANVSIAKSISFRSDNSPRINLEVSGTESGSNAGGNFYIKTYSDTGVQLSTPFIINRATGVITIANTLSASGIQANAIEANNNGTDDIGSASGNKFRNIYANAFIPSGSTVPTNGMYLSAANTLNFATNTTNRFSISSTGAATFLSSVSATTNLSITSNFGASNTNSYITLSNPLGGGGGRIRATNTFGDLAAIEFSDEGGGDDGNLRFFTALNASLSERLRITSSGGIRVFNFTSSGLVGTDASGNLGVVNSTYTEVAVSTYSKPSGAPSMPNGSQVAANLRDHNYSSLIWGTTGAATSENQGAGVSMDFGSARAIRRISLYAYNVNPIDSWRVDYSDDNSNWTAIQSFPNIFGAPLVFDFNRTGTESHRYWRIIILSWTVRDATNWYVMECVPYI